VTTVIEGIADELKATLDKITPHTATVEFGLEVTGEPGFSPPLSSRDRQRPISR
jgi:hypothetical protein